MLAKLAGDADKAADNGLGCGPRDAAAKPPSCASIG
jgi:hypothetical protein